jgi:hypothetical protein
MKELSKKQFRMLLTICILAFVASTLAEVFGAFSPPQPNLDSQMHLQGATVTVGVLGISVLGIPGIIAGLASIIGLYRFWPSARWLSVATWAYMLVWMAFSPGPVVSNAVAGAFSQCSTLLAGCVLAIVYFSPAADWFRKPEAPH